MRDDCLLQRDKYIDFPYLAVHSPHHPTCPRGVFRHFLLLTTVELSVKQPTWCFKRDEWCHDISIGRSSCGRLSADTKKSNVTVNGAFTVRSAHWGECVIICSELPFVGRKMMPSSWWGKPTYPRKQIISAMDQY